MVTQSAMLLHGYPFNRWVIIIHDGIDCEKISLLFFSFFLALRKSVVKGRLPEDNHVHTFPSGGEKYNSEDDSWTKTCADCGFQVTFEKM